jgi:hypothetical protein
MFEKLDIFEISTVYLRMMYSNLLFHQTHGLKRINDN